MDATDLNIAINPQAGAVLGQLSVNITADSSLCVQQCQEFDQRLIILEGNALDLSVAILAVLGLYIVAGAPLVVGASRTDPLVADYISDQVAGLQRSVGGVHHEIAVDILIHSQAVGIVQLHTDVLILEGQVVQLGVTGVGQLEVVSNRILIIHNAAVGDVLTHLVDGLGSGLFGMQRRVSDDHVGHDAAVGAVAVTLHVVEVEPADLTLHQIQSQRPVVLILGVAGSGIVAILGINSRHDLSCPFNVLVDLEALVGDGVGTAQVQNDLVVDEQINVIVAFEFEEQAVLLVVDKFTVAGHGVVEVSVRVGALIRSQRSYTVIIEVVGVRRTGKITLCIGNGQEGEAGGGVGGEEEELVLGVDVLHVDRAFTLGNGAIRIYGHTGVINDGRLAAGLVSRIVTDGGTLGILITGTVTRVKDIGSLAVVHGGVLQSEVAVIILQLVIGIGIEQAVEQEVSRIHAGGDIISDALKLTDQILLGSLLIAAQRGIGATLLAEGKADTQTAPQSGSQIHRSLISFSVVVAVQVSHADLAVAVQVEAAKDGAGAAGDVVIVIVAVGINLRNGQGSVQHHSHIFHSLLPVDRPSVLQRAFQHTGGHTTLSQSGQQLIAVQIQLAHIEAIVGAVAIVRSGGKVEDVIGGTAGTGCCGSRAACRGVIGGKAIAVHILTGAVGREAVSIEHVVTDTPSIVAGTGVGAAAAVDTVAPAAALRGIQQAEGQVVTAAPVSAGQADGIAGGAGDSLAAVHVGSSIGAEVIGHSGVGEVSHISQIKALAADQRRQIHAHPSELTLGRILAKVAHIGVLGTDSRGQIHDHIGPLIFRNLKIQCIGSTGAGPVGCISQTRDIVGGGITAGVALCPEAVLVGIGKAIGAVDQHQIVHILGLGRGAICRLFLPELGQDDPVSAGVATAVGQAHILLALILGHLGDGHLVHGVVLCARSGAISHRHICSGLPAVIRIGAVAGSIRAIGGGLTGQIQTVVSARIGGSNLIISRGAGGGGIVAVIGTEDIVRLLHLGQRSLINSSGGDVLGQGQQLTGVVAECLGIDSKLLCLEFRVKERHMGNVQLIGGVQRGHIQIQRGNVAAAVSRPGGAHDGRDVDDLGSPLGGIFNFHRGLGIAAALLQPDGQVCFIGEAAGLVNQHHVTDARQLNVGSAADRGGGDKVLQAERAAVRRAVFGDPQEPGIDEAVVISGSGGLDVVGGGHHGCCEVVGKTDRLPGGLVAEPCRTGKVRALINVGLVFSAAIQIFDTIIVGILRSNGGILDIRLGAFKKDTIVQIVINLHGPVNGVLAAQGIVLDAGIAGIEVADIGRKNARRDHRQDHNQGQQQGQRSTAHAVLFHGSFSFHAYQNTVLPQRKFTILYNVWSSGLVAIPDNAGILRKMGRFFFHRLSRLQRAEGHHIGDAAQIGPVIVNFLIIYTYIFQRPIAIVAHRQGVVHGIQLQRLRVQHRILPE